jgi:hypothetical protein
MDHDEEKHGGTNPEDIQHNHSLGSKGGDDSYPSSPTGLPSCNWARALAQWLQLMLRPSLVLAALICLRAYQFAAF